MNKQLLFASLVAVVLFGCATPYQSSSFTGGFTDTQLAPDLFRIAFAGNGRTSRDRVQDFALLRAAELSLANNFRFFAVVETADQSRNMTITLPGSAQTSGTITGGYGNTATYSGTTTYTPPQTQNIFNPGVGLLVRAFSEKPEGVFSYDAQFVNRSIKLKYDIK